MNPPKGTTKITRNLTGLYALPERTNLDLVPHLHVQGHTDTPSLLWISLSLPCQQTLIPGSQAKKLKQDQVIEGLDLSY